MYQEIFEGPFLEASGEFYSREASELLQQSDVTRYMERVTWRLSQEELRAHKFLHHSSTPKVCSLINIVAFFGPKQKTLMYIHFLNIGTGVLRGKNGGSSRNLAAH